jgi:ATP-dependent Lon protease
MPGAGTLTLTGHLGDVMKESARAALSWFRAHAAAYGADPDFFKNAEIHLHVPSGAIPKDGPSAGVTIAAALASELTRRPVRGDIAMTGEITLSGRVLPVGGIKEKVLAARRAGIREVILPRQNEKDVKEDLTEELRRELTIHLVQSVDEVLLLALLPGPKGAGTRTTDRRVHPRVQ